jgi:hypothetical protein
MNINFALMGQTLLAQEQKNRKKDSINRKLLLTERGQEWLSQFDDLDKGMASRLVNSLTLVSHSSFDRTLDCLIRQTKDSVKGPIALFATRELKKKKKTEFVKDIVSTDTKLSLDAVSRGSDLGSEARVAATIRSICKSSPAFLNHPTVEQMRTQRCDAIVVVDDLVGSGTRSAEFLGAIWESRSIRSWLSRKNVQIIVICYAATKKGKARVERLMCHPTVKYEIACPVITSLPWPKKLRDRIDALCEKYGPSTSRPRIPLGYCDIGALLVFEHGCPNNAPSILWAPQTTKTNWLPLFPDRTILPKEKSAFPSEIERRDPISVLVEAGQTRLSRAVTSAPPPISEETLLVLAFAAKRVLNAGALSFATGLTDRQCATILQDCVRWGFLTITYRLTDAGRAELKTARKVKKRCVSIAPKGEEDYYPRMLREAT